MSLLSQFFPNSNNSSIGGNFGTTLSADLGTFPIDILLVGGGGGGGIVPSTKNAGCPGFCDPNSAIGGGGGGGRVIQMLGAVISTGVAYPITVGAGGAAGENGGTTCFGTFLIAGGGGGAGTPGRFGRGKYENYEISEFAGSWGADTTFACPQLGRIYSPNPIYPYYTCNSTDTYVNSGRRNIPCLNYSDTTNPLTYYDKVSGGFGHCIQFEGESGASSPLSPYNSPQLYDCGSFSYGAGSSICGPCYLNQGCYLQPWYGGEASTCETFFNAIFKKICHPATCCNSFFGFGGQSGYGVGYYPCTSFPQAKGAFGCNCMQAWSTGHACSCGIFNLVCFYSEGLMNACFPNMAFHTPSCPSFASCTPLGGLYPNCAICEFCGNTNIERYNAKGARAQFCPVSNTCIRTAMLLTDCYSVVDHGPGLFNGPRCMGYLNFTSMCPPLNNLYPSWYEVSNNPCFNIVNLNNLNCSVSGIRACVTPSYYSVIAPCSGPCIVRGRLFTPSLLSVGIATNGNCSCADAATSCPFIPLLCAPVAPVVDAACWTAAENGTAGWGGGGGGGINVGGIGTSIVFRYQYNSTVPCGVVRTDPLGCIDFGDDYFSTNVALYPSCPTVCYMRCIGPSPTPVATGGSGGSGAVYIVYPTNYPAATVTGNTAVPSPPAYRVYYWQGNGTITFNK